MSTEMNTSAENISAENTSLLRSTNIGGNVYRVYRKRWFVLLVVTLINFSNGIVSRTITYSLFNFNKLSLLWDELSPRKFLFSFGLRLLQ